MDRWKDKVAVVTGASSGIGAAVARRLVESGMIVVGVARRVERLQELKKGLPENRFFPVQCDVGVEEDIVRLFQTIDKKLGRVNVLINNAGVAHQTPMTNANAETLQALFATNCIGPALCTREALKLMKSHNIESGSILFTNSVVGHIIIPSAPGAVLNNYGYTASKYALRAMVEGLRQELRAQGSKIRVGEVSPGAVATELGHSFARSDDDKKAAQESLETFKQRFGGIQYMMPDDIADAYIYMLSTPDRADVNEIIVNHMQK